MKRLIEFGVEDGEIVVVEVEEPEPEGGLVRAARPGEVAERAKQTFESALSRIQPMATVVIRMLRELADRPDEVHVEFGIKLTGQAGAVLASAGVEANYLVTLTWIGKGNVSTKVSAKAETEDGSSG